MIFLKPTWVNHEGDKPIFSIDIHPKGGRFATGGQGESCGKIVIWNIAPVLSEDDESNSSIPKMLCQMDNHLACVNVVRWSNDGHFLASGADDKLVMIWRLTNEGSSSVFGSRNVNVETWKCVHTLNAHTGDVLDVAWAPHDGWLASGSVDNTIIIWNANKFPEKVTSLKGHTGLVKGVTWDPVGKYLASQSDDRTLKVWRTGDWTEEVNVTDPFVDSSATTHVLRLSWSPDGQYLVSAHAMNGGGPTAQIIERDGWRQDKDFVGHRKAVTCVRFNNNILKTLASGSPKAQQYCCCAIGSRDRSISVWLTSLKRPLVVIKDLFEDSVLDISWSKNGSFLLACSSDGTVACVTFGENEIGTPLSMSEKNALYERVYHKSSWNMSFTGSQIAENPDILTAIDKVNENTTKPKVQQEELTPKKQTKESPPAVVVDSPAVSKNILVPANKQMETRLPSGKRRITPMFLTTVPSTDVNKSSDTNLNVPIFNEASTFSSSSPIKSRIVVETLKDQPKISVNTKSVPKVNVQPINQNQMVLQAPGSQITQLMCCEVPGNEPITQIINILDPVKLAPGTTVTKTVGSIKIQITNRCHKTSKGSLAKIEVYKTTNEKQPMWDTFLGTTIRCAAANRKIIVVCCEDLTVNSYDIMSGARVLPPLLIEDAVSSLCLSNDSYCLVLTKTGLVYMWNFSAKSCVLSRVSVRSLLTGKGSVNGFSLSSTNMPVITISDGRAYSYSTDLQTWIVLSNPADPLVQAGATLSRKPISSLPLSSLQKSIRIQNSNDSLPPGVALSFLESQITLCIALKSSQEYKHWLFVLVNHLLEKGPECRLRMILDDLLGPTNKKRDNTILEFSKHGLLSEVLDVIKTKLAWQRLYKEYSEQLNELN